MDLDSPPMVRNDNEYLALQQNRRASSVGFRQNSSFRPLPSPDPRHQGVFRTARGAEWVDRDQTGNVIGRSTDQAV